MEAQERRVKRSRTLATSTEKAYMAIAAAEAVIVFAIAFSVFGLIEANIPVQDGDVRTVPVYLAIFILAQIFSLLYVFDALRARNIVQLILHLIFNIAILIYSIIQIPQTRNAMKSEGQNACGHFEVNTDNKHIHLLERCIGPHSLFNMVQKLFIVTPIVLGICSVAFGFLIRALFVQFGWAVFYLVGASPEMKRMHRDYQTLISLLKLLLFFALAFCMSYLILVTSSSQNKAELIVTVIALPLAVVCMFACGWALRTENKPVMAACLVTMVAGLVYFVYKLASMWLPRTAYLYINTKVTMAIFAAFSITILLVTFAYGCLCMSNFGKGLIQAHRNPENRTSLWAIPDNARYEEKMARGEVGTATVEDDRMVID